MMKWANAVGLEQMSQTENRRTEKPITKATLIPWIAGLSARFIVFGTGVYIVNIFNYSTSWKSEKGFNPYVNVQNIWIGVLNFFSYSQIWITLSCTSI